MEGGPSKINPNHSRSDQMSDLDTRNTQKLLNKLLEKKINYYQHGLLADYLKNKIRPYRDKEMTK